MARALPTRNGRRGFTIVELMVASSITAVALLGVYGVLSQALSVEKSTGRKWEDRATATAIVAEMAECLEQSAALLKGHPAVAGGRGAGGEYWLECVTAYGSEWPGAGWPRRIRYSWNPQEADAEGVTIFRQVARYAGTRCIEPIEDAETLEGPAFWAVFERHVVASGLRNLAVRYEPLGRPEQAGESWSGELPAVVVRLRAACGGQVVERIVAPAARSQGEGK